MVFYFSLYVFSFIDLSYTLNAVRYTNDYFDWLTDLYLSLNQLTK